MRGKEWKRVYGSRERVAWIQSLPSVASGLRPCVNAHVTPNADPPSGMGRKPDARWIVPLTDHEHRELHTWGKATFENHYRVDLVAKAELVNSVWEQRR